MGTIVTDSSTAPRDGIAEALFGQTKRRVLSLLFGRPDRSFYLREIARETGSGTGAVQRELAQLVAAGLIRRSREGQHVYFTADPGSPVYDEMRSLIAKTAGIADVLRAALADLPGKAEILIAFIYGSVAAGQHTSASDIDLMIVGRLELADLLPALGPTQERLGREVNPTIYRPEDLAERLDQPGSFVRRVLDGPRIMLLGNDDDIAKLAGKPVAHDARPESRGSRRPARGR
jgi:predicted nucleotidyltransferase